MTLLLTNVKVSAVVAGMTTGGLYSGFLSSGLGHVGDS